MRMMGRLLDLLRLFREVDTPVSAETMRYATLWPNIENSKALAERKLCLRAPAETFADTLTWMVDTGHIERELCPGLSVKADAVEAAPA